MNKTTLKKAMITSAISAMTLFGATSCGGSGKHDNKANAPTEQTMRETEQMRSEQERFLYNACESARDSLLHKNGYYDKKFKVDDFSTYTKIDSIENKLKYPNQHRLSEQVKITADKIVHKYVGQMVNVLKSYKVNADAEQLAHAYMMTSGWVDEYMFVGAKLPENGIQHKKLSLTDPFILQIFTESAYRSHECNFHSNIVKFSDARKKEIIGKIREICNRMESEIYNNRKEIEKSFARYFPMLDKSQIPSQYVYDYDVAIIPCGGEMEYSFGYLENPLLKPVISVTKHVSVYDSGLDIDFFADNNAEYRLHQVGKGKWQVIKTFKNGTVKKSHVFTDNAESKLYIDMNDNDTFPQENATQYSPGSNIGVHVYAQIPVYKKVASAKNIWPAETEKQMQAELNKLRAEYKQQQKLINARINIEIAASQEAMKIAKQRLQQKYGEKLVLRIH